MIGPLTFVSSYLAYALMIEKLPYRLALRADGRTTVLAESLGLLAATLVAWIELIT